MKNASAKSSCRMPKTINAVFENGVFRPLEKIQLPEHKKITITLSSTRKSSLRAQHSLKGIIDIARDCPDTDLSLHHDKYLYGEGND